MQFLDMRTGGQGSGRVGERTTDGHVLRDGRAGPRGVYKVRGHFYILTSKECIRKCA